MNSTPYKAPDSELSVVPVVEIPVDILEGIKHAWLAPLVLSILGVLGVIFYFYQGYQGAEFLVKSGVITFILFSLSVSFYMRVLIPSFLILLAFCSIKIWEYLILGTLPGIAGLIIILYFSIKGFISIYKLNNLEKTPNQ